MATSARGWLTVLHSVARNRRGRRAATIATSARGWLTVLHSVARNRRGRRAATIATSARGWLTVLHSVATPGAAGHGAPSRRPATEGARERSSSLRHRSINPPLRGPARTLITRGVVRGIRQQHGPGADGAAVPALPAARHRLAGRLAADLRRRRYRLGRRHGHGGRRF